MMKNKLAVVAGIFLFAFAAVALADALYPCPIDADLWLLAGQSNMVGQDFPTNCPTAEDPRIVAFDMTDQWMTAKNPLHRIFEAAAPVHKNIFMQNVGRKLTNAVAAEKFFESAHNDMARSHRGVGLGIPFAQSVLQETGRPIGLIPCAHGGTSMAQWNPALKDQGGNSLYGAMMERVKMVGGGSKIKGLLWYQGESETGSTNAIATYEKNFLNLIDSVRRDLEQPELPIIYVQIGRYVHSPDLGVGYEQIRDWQRRISKERKNIYFTTAIDQPLFDRIHVSGAGQKILGHRVAELALTYVYGKLGHGQQIDLESATVRDSGKQIHLKFSGVTGKLQSPGRPEEQFELRGDWTDEKEASMVFRVEFDPADPAALNLAVEKPIKGSVKLVCGAGINPYMNVVDDKNMPIPAFGPVELTAEK